MSEAIFSSVQTFSGRDCDVAELIARLALNIPLVEGLTTRLGLDDAQVQKLRTDITNFERMLSKQNITLSALLASTAKSKCCS